MSDQIGEDWVRVTHSLFRSMCDRIGCVVEFHDDHTATVTETSARCGYCRKPMLAEHGDSMVVPPIAGLSNPFYSHRSCYERAQA